MKAARIQVQKLDSTQWPSVSEMRYSNRRPILAARASPIRAAPATRPQALALGPQKSTLQASLQTSLMHDTEKLHTATGNDAFCSPRMDVEGLPLSGTVRRARPTVRLRRCTPVRP